MSIRMPDAFAFLVLALIASLWAMTKVDDMWKERLLFLSWVLVIAIIFGTLITAYWNRRYEGKAPRKA